MHLFDIDIPGKITFQESKTLSPGNAFCSFKTGEYLRDLSGNNKPTVP